MFSHILEDPAFTIRLAPDRQLVDIDYHGYWDAATAQRYDGELRRMLVVLRGCGCPRGEQVTILDMTDFPVQSQDMLAKLGAMATDPAFRSRRIAIVLSSALSKMQAKRTAPNYGLFENRTDALAWVSEVPS